MLLLVFVILIATVNAAGLQKELPHVYCGRTLANARMLYCYGITKKRTRNIPLGTSLYSDEDTKMWPWKPSHFAHSRGIGLATRAKRDPGLFDECCFKPCYANELLSYC